MKRLECLDGLRGVLAVYVLLGHLAPFAALPRWLTQPLSHGGAAVDVFFILSGLVIVRSLESFGYRPAPFLIARMARILPLYLVLFALAVAVQPLPTGLDRMAWIAADSPGRDIASQGWPQTWLVEIAAHLTMTHGLFPDALLPDVWVRFLGAAWSLSTEWQFYVLALCLGMRGMRFGHITRFLLLVGLAGACWRIGAPAAWQFSRAFLPNKAEYFALGVVSALLVRDRRRAMPAYAATLAATLALALAHGGIDKLLPPLLWTLCLAAQLKPDWRLTAGLAQALRTRALLWLGTTSYGIYLANEPVQKLLGLALSRLVFGNAMLFTALWLPLATLLPIAMAGWLHHAVEAPALHRGRRLARLAGLPRADWPIWGFIRKRV